MVVNEEDVGRIVKPPKDIYIEINGKEEKYIHTKLRKIAFVVFCAGVGSIVTLIGMLFFIIFCM